MFSKLYNITVTDAAGRERSMSEFQGKTLLIVNTASKCGYTPQYTGLQKLYESYKGRDFLVLGFPCNQFGGQEPGEMPEILDFCHTRFHITFPIFQKVDVNGKGAHPLFVFLKAQAPGILGTEAIKWNFTKFLVDPKAQTVHRFASKDTPEDVETYLLEKILTPTV